MNVVEQLEKLMRKEDARRVAKLTKNYDNYVTRMKKELNELLEPLGYHVLTGILFQKMEAKEINGDKN